MPRIAAAAGPPISVLTGMVTTTVGDSPPVVGRASTLRVSSSRQNASPRTSGDSRATRSVTLGPAAHSARASRALSALVSGLPVPPSGSASGWVLGWVR